MVDGGDNALALSSSRMSNGDEADPINGIIDKLTR